MAKMKTSDNSHEAMCNILVRYYEF